MHPNVVLTTAYFPPVQYFTKFILYNKVMLEQHENYSKQSYRNRCHILSANGPLALSIPIVKKHHEKMPIKEVKIDYTTLWQKIHWKAIESAYGKSPFFLYYKDDLLPFFSVRHETLFDFNLQIITTILKILGIRKAITMTSEYSQPADADDLRQVIHPKKNKQDPHFTAANYYQTFKNQDGFVSELSILDLLFNEGNESISVLKKCIIR